MAYNIMRDALEHTIKRRRKDKWMKAISGMAAVVVFCTTYALILPAITMEQEPVCGIEEHVHTDECYELPKELTCDSLESKVTVVHHHDEFCYNASGELICSLPEVEAHTHTDECYETVVPQEPHVHTADCWETTQICDREEHTHTDDCLDEEGNVVCGKEEHTHGEGCFEKKAVCGMTEATAEELAAYADGPVTKLICGKNEVIPHTHTDECYDDAGHIICGMKEVLVHQHTAECLTDTTDPTAEPVLVCTKTEHEHTDECFNTADVESPIDWEITLPEITDRFDYAANLVAVAESQLGYHESIDNTKVGADGTIYGYTRYGQWAETPYGDWSLHFLDFCLHYAKIPADAFPVHEGQSRWCDQLKEENWSIYWTPAQYASPVPGDIVYLDLNLDGKLDAAAIVKEFTEAVEASEDQEAQKAVLTVIQGAVPGESSREVAVMKYDASDAVILGYACLDSAMTRYEIMNPAFGLEEEEEVEEAPAALYFCGQTEHTHGAACYDEENNLICQIPEHTHTEACAVPQPSYRCGLTEHEHDEYCRDNEGNLLCKLEEHKHTDACVVYYICGQTEHKHTDECYDENGELTCTVPEHTHDASCILLDQTVDAEIVTQFSLLNLFETDKPSVTVSGILPQGVTVTAEPVEVEGLAFAFDINIFDANGEKFEPLVPVEVTFVVPGITDNPDLALKACHVPVIEDEESEEPVYGEPEYADSTTAENGGLTATIPHFTVWGAVPMAAGLGFGNGNELDQCQNDKKCEMNDFLNWEDCSGTNPFGGAAGFNLFLLGNMDNWGDAHGNCAIMGNVTGTSNGLGYPAGSNFDYAGNMTDANKVALILGGYPQTTLPLQVSNGSVLMQAQYDDHSLIQLDKCGNPANHYHHFTAEELKAYFETARGWEGTTAPAPSKEAYAPGSLSYHNVTIDEYVDKVTDPNHPENNDGHAGTVRFLLQSERNDENKYEVPHDRSSVVLEGSNPFYNVFNISPEFYSLDGTAERAVYMEVPQDSYTIINIMPPENGTVIDSFCMHLWYREYQDGVFTQWTAQPAKHVAAGIEFSQTQMTLMNFDPSITGLNITGQGVYIYTSVLAPNMVLDVTVGDVHIQGTTVLKDMKGLPAENSSLIDNPFLTGATLHLQKDTVCDAVTDETVADHSATHIPSGNAETCHIEDSRGDQQETAWAGFYADLQFNMTSVPGEPGTLMVKKHLPMNGKNLDVSGLSPGNYQITDEVVYKEIKVGEETRRLTIDQDGNWMRVRYVEPGTEFARDPNGGDARVMVTYADHWTTYYCDETGVEFFTKPGYTNEADVTKVKITEADNFHIFGHFWNFAVFKDRKTGTVYPSIDVQTNHEYNLDLINHYDLKRTESRFIAKRWFDADGKDITPPNAKIQVTLMQLDDPTQPKTQAIKAPCAGENPITLSSDNEWLGMWTGLEEGKFYYIKEIVGYPGYTPHEPSYNVVEDGAGKYTVEWTQYNEDKHMFVLVNEKGKTEDAALTVEKLWFDADDNQYKPTPAEIAAKTYQSQVTIYRQTGKAPEKAKVMDLVNKVQVVADGSNVVSEPSYFFGESDVLATVEFFVKSASQNLADIGYSYLGWKKIVITDGTEDLGDHQTPNIQPVGNSAGEYYYKVTVAVEMLNLATDKQLTVSLDTDDPNTIHPAEILVCPDGLYIGDVLIKCPSVVVEEERIADKWILWDNDPGNLHKLTNDEFPAPGEKNDVQLADSDWTYTWHMLPSDNKINILSEDDSVTIDCPWEFYRYYVLETDVKPDNYAPTYNYFQVDTEFGNLTMEEILAANQAAAESKPPQPEPYPGVTGDYIIVSNKPVKPTGGLELPAAGGMGTTPYTFGGLLAASAAFFLLQYNSKKRRKEDDPL